MAGLQFLHGVEVIELDSGPRSVRTVRSAVIGLIGTAPDADANLFPVNTPVLIAGSRLEAEGLGRTGTLPNAVDLIFDQIGAFIVVVRVEEGQTYDGTVANILGGVSNGQYRGVHAFLAAQSATGAQPRILIAPGFTSDRPSGVTSIAITNRGSGFTSAPTVALSGGGGYNAAAVATITNGLNAVTVGAGGTGYTNASVEFIGGGGSGASGTVQLSAGVVTGITLTQKGRGYTSPPTVVITGDGTGATASVTITGMLDTLVVTNGGISYESAPTVAFSGGGGTGAAATASIGIASNPVVAELIGIATRLRAVIVADGPDTTDAAAITYRGDWGSRRVYVVDPKVKVVRGTSIMNEPASSAVAGLIAKIDFERGFWWSPSNQVINGIVGTSREIDFTLGDPNSRANFLNENEVATIILEDGYRLWGNRTAADDNMWAFLNVVRTNDIILDSIMRAHRWAVDRNITRQYFEEVSESVNAYLRTLTALGAILGGECTPDPELNSIASIQDGKVWFNIRWTPVYPAEHVIFRSQIVGDYIEELI